MSDHYNLLGVPPQASAADLRKAFRREAKRCHPDALAGRPEAEREAARLRFIQLVQAYQVLSDPGRRRAYDRGIGAGRGARAAAAPGQEPPRAGRPGGPPPRPGGSRPEPQGRVRPAAGPGAQRAGRTPKSAPRGSPGPAPELRDILREADEALFRFGMDPRQPAEVAVEELLDWAKALYRDLVGAVTGSTAGTAQPAGTRAPGSGSPRAMGRSAGARQDRVAAGLDGLSVERELEQIKRRVRGSARRSGPPGRGTASAPTVDDELADLKRRHGKKR